MALIGHSQERQDGKPIKTPKGGEAGSQSRVRQRSAPSPPRRPTGRSGEALRNGAAGGLLCPVRFASLCHGGCAAFGPVGGLLAGRRAQGAVEDSAAGEGGRWVPDSVVYGAAPVCVALLEV